jgi:hypothetical protein
MELAWVVQHHLDGALVLVELVTLALLTPARSPRASMDSGHLLRAVLVVMTFILPLAVAVSIVVSALDGCRLGLPLQPARIWRTPL